MSTFKLFFLVKFFLFKEYLQAVCRWYRKLSFALIDSTLLLPYLFLNPYRICRKYGEKKHLQNLYGETPLTTLYSIATQINLSTQHTLYELGSGRGRGAFFLSSFFHCKVVGIEQVPLFFYTSQFTKKLCRQEGVSFQHGNFLVADLSSATHIYLYGTLLTSWEIQQFLQNPTLPKNVQVITISYPLSDYSPLWKEILSFPVRFPWGETNAYISTQASR